MMARLKNPAKQDIFFSNSLIFHEEKRIQMATVKVCKLKFGEFLLRFCPSIINGVFSVPKLSLGNINRTLH